jgi:hypothetical protein
MGAQRKRKRVVKPPDMGTPEQQQKREILIGKGANPQLGAYPLGVLLARGTVTLDQHNVGLRYAGLYREVNRVGPREPSIGAEPNVDALYAMQDEYWRVTDALLSCGRKVKEATDVICALLDHQPAAVLTMDVEPLKTGLRTLEKFYYTVDLRRRRN